MSAWVLGGGISQDKSDSDQVMDTYFRSTVKVCFLLMQRPSGSERLLPAVSILEVTGQPEIFSSWGSEISVKISSLVAAVEQGDCKGHFSSSSLKSEAC